MAERKSRTQRNGSEAAEGDPIRLTTYVPRGKHEQILRLSGPKGVSAWIAHAIDLGLKDGFTIKRKTVAQVQPS